MQFLLNDICISSRSQSLCILPPQEPDSILHLLYAHIHSYLDNYLINQVKLLSIHLLLVSLLYISKYLSLSHLIY